VGAEVCYFLDDLLESDCIVEEEPFDCMRHNWLSVLVVHIDFHALDSSLQILHVPLYLTVTRQLIAR
jgi:hypothetical protein